jgi:hypothetical protein
MTIGACSRSLLSSRRASGATRRSRWRRELPSAENRRPGCQRLVPPSSFSEWVEIRMTGVSRASAASRRVSPRPSSSPSWKSTSTTSGPNVRARRTTSAPDEARPRPRAPDFERTQRCNEASPTSNTPAGRPLIRQVATETDALFRAIVVRLCSVPTHFPKGAVR